MDRELAAALCRFLDAIERVGVINAIRLELWPEAALAKSDRRFGESAVAYWRWNEDLWAARSEQEQAIARLRLTLDEAVVAGFPQEVSDLIHVNFDRLLELQADAVMQTPLSPSTPAAPVDRIRLGELARLCEWFEEVANAAIADAEAEEVGDEQRPALLSDDRWRIAGEVVVLEATETAVLRSLVELGSCNLDQFRTQSGCHKAPEVLKRILSKRPSLAAYVTLPGKKGAGGYRSTILDERAPAGSIRG